MEEIKVTDEDRSRYMRQIVPFGSLDIGTAIATAKEAGYDAEWAADQVLRMVDECDVKVEDVDPVAEVYEAILQEARSQIEEETEYDLCNDAVARGAIYTAGNYCATSYDYSEEAKEELAEKLGKHEVEVDDLGPSTQWFLKECGIDQEMINKYKKSEQETDTE